ncbi:fimbrial biogenesis outer membrane usher protein [Pseudomonas vancouverensis]|uniref:Fimbrial biogenesis outer membrane usher protein n=2 Tax=Pseudomonas vancouverensis TaxID=95300 RepID=A0A4R4KG15_PSEVA|nr:fimbrial biogenesis outer membrane usher protein [Pseudomonas vancouverensis]TDB65776.1 fimbrial biogenesis outer membrane usher protein [Pseudomonas vancouverensis]
MGLLSATGAHADQSTSPATTEFDSQFLQVLGQNVDLKRFEQAGSVEPGTYKLEIFINAKGSVRQTVEVKAGAEGQSPRYCFKASHVKQWGVDASKLPDQENVAKILASDCIEPQKLIPQATFEMDMGSLSGNLSIPQAYAGRVERNYVAPEDWDEGITAGFVSYNANAYHSQPDSGDSNTQYSSSINSGFNVAGWRLRHNGNYTNSKGLSAYQSLNSYAQTDVTPLKSQLTLGEYFTPGDSFDSIPFSGVQIASDDGMLPDSERGFAPVIRGVADTNAKVTVRQGESVIYQTSVAPGPFVIDDLYATSYSGDMEVTVTEANGQEKRFTVPFASVVQMLRPGSSRFSVTTGEYRDDSLSKKPKFAQATYRRGITNNLSVYTGGLMSQDYASGLAGIAIGTPYGAFAFDTTFSRASNLPTTPRTQDQYGTDQSRNTLDGSASGKSYRVSYSKLLDSTNTNLAVAAYRFSSDEYLDFSDFAALQDNNGTPVYRERNRAQLNVSQPIGDYGDLYVSGLTRSYWDGRQNSTTYQVGYSKSFNWGSVGVTASRSLDDEQGYGNQYMFTVSLPLGSDAHSPRLSSTLNVNEAGDYNSQTMLSGSAGKNNQLNYGVYANVGKTDGDSSQGFGGNAQYQTSVAQVGASASSGAHYKQYSASARGTVIAHSGGVVFTPAQGETMALVEAKGAEGARLTSGDGDVIDSSGYGAVAGLNPYRNNSVGLDPKGLSDDVELKSTSQTVAPRRGAIVKLEYDTVVGKPLLLQIQPVAGHEIPFGSDVLNDKGESVAMVGQGGLVFIRGEQSALRVVWGIDADQHCQLTYTEPKGTTAQAYEQVPAQCPIGTAKMANR